MSEDLFTQKAHVLGPFADDHAVVAERVAIDVTNALRGAEAGLRGFRRRPLLKRLWDGITGQGQELQAAIGQDLVTVQRAALSLVREVMHEEARTQYCVNKVLVNLHAVNCDLDDLQKRTARLEGELTRQVAALRAEFYQALQAESKRLAEEIDGLRRDLNREAGVRRLTKRYRAGELTANAGEVLGSSLYMASVSLMHWDDGPVRVKAEWRAARAVVSREVSQDSPVPLEDALLEVGEAVTPAALEPTLYLAQEEAGVLGVVARLVERRLGGLSLREEDASDAIAIVQAVSDPDHQLESGLVRNTELIQVVARSLLPAPKMEEE